MTYGNLKSEIDNSPVLPMSKAITNNIVSLVLPQVASATLLDFQDALTDIVLLSDGDPVSTWADQSGNGHDFTQTGDARPIKQTIDGYPIVVFDGVNDFMDGGNFGDNLNSLAFIAVCRARNNNTSAILAKEDAAAGYEFYTNFLQIFQDSLAAYINDTTAISLSADTRYVLTGELLDRSDMHFYINGDNTGEDVHNHGPLTNYSALSNVLLVPYLERVDLHAILIYQITDLINWPTDRAAITTWLANRYGITLP